MGLANCCTWALCIRLLYKTRILCTRCVRIQCARYQVYHLHTICHRVVSVCTESSDEHLGCVCLLSEVYMWKRDKSSWVSEIDKKIELTISRWSSLSDNGNKSNGCQLIWCPGRCWWARTQEFDARNPSYTKKTKQNFGSWIPARIKFFLFLTFQRRREKRHLVRMHTKTSACVLSKFCVYVDWFTQQVATNKST